MHHTTENDRGSTILVVDDDRILLSAVERMLGLSGIRVLAATSASDALDAICSESRVDAVLCDLNLGATSGTELLRKLLGLRPAMKCMIMTGGVREALPFDTSEFSVLMKPFSLQELLAAVRALLEPVGCP